MKLKIMKLINSNKNWRDILSKPPYNLSIKDDGKHTIIKYNQLFSDFKEPIVREARGLIIKKSGYAFKLVCMPFTKFFALGDPNALGDLKRLYMKRKWLVEEKIDGCFPYNTLITMEDGSHLTIGQIVNQKIDKKVLSYNLKTGKIEAKKIIGWKKQRANDDEWLCIKCNKASKKINSKSTSSVELQLTKNHKVFVRDKSQNIVEKYASELKVGDVVFNHIVSLNNTQKQVILGGLLGDSSFRNYKNSEVSNAIIMRHSQKQKDYVKYKGSLLGGLFIHYKEFKVKNSYANEKVEAWTYSSQSIKKIYDLCVKNSHKYITKKWLEQLDWLGIAIWYMDDGSLNKGTKNPSIYLHTEGYSKKENETIISYFASKGIKAYLRQNKKYYFIAISVKDSVKIWDNIKTFVPPSMQYKLPEKYQGKFETINNDENIQYELNECKIISIKQKCNYVKMNNGSNKFDIQIDGNSNYFADGILVHNSLIKLWWDNDEWHVATNGTIDASKAEVQEGENSEFPNYLALFKYASKDKIDYSKLNQHYTYMFELVSPENKVVCAYNTPTIYYLGRRNIKTLKEVSYFEDDCLGLEKCKRPRCTVIYPKTSPKKAMAELKHKVDSLTTSDENFEGVVISDEGLKSRIKIKSSENIRLSKIKGNGILTDKKILFMIINSLDDDAIQAFPEYRPKFEKVKSQLSKWIDDINKDIKYLKSNSWNNQKEFAEWAKETTYSPFMFTAYKSENDFNLKEEIQKMNLDKLLLEIKKGNDIK